MRLRDWPIPVSLAAPGLIACLPAFDNGFIADDCENVLFARSFLEDPGYVFTIPPQKFRMTTSLVLGLGECLAGTMPAL